MATYYWVGGNGTWDNATNTNWSSLSGGSGGAGVPTTADNVIFDNGSGASPQVTIGTTPACANWTVSAPTSGSIKFIGTGALTVAGSMTFPATNVTAATTAFSITFTAATSVTITPPAVTLTTGNITFNNASGTWTLGAALTLSGTITLTAGSFSTSASNYSVTASGFSSNNSNTRSVTLNSSTLTLSGTSPWTFTTTTGLTFSGASSTIDCSSSGPSFQGGGLTYGTITFSSTGITGASFNGSNTCTNFTIAARGSVGTSSVTTNGNQTISGTFTVNSGATSAARRIRILSNTGDTARTITSATNSFTNVDFRDITGAGAGSWDGSAASWGDLGGNSGITFRAPRNIYWVGGAGNWSSPSTRWSTSSGGGATDAAFPIAQDIAIINDSSGAAPFAITYDTTFMLPTIDATNRTLATVTFTLSSATAFLYGDFKMSSAMAISATTQTLLPNAGASKTQYITSAGVSFPNLNITKSSGSVILNDNTTVATAKTFTLTNGTFDLNGKTFTTGLFNSNGTSTRSIAYNSGKIVVTDSNATVWNCTDLTNFTYTGTPTNEFNYSGSTGTRTIINGNTSGSETTALGVSITAGSDIVSMTGTNYINALNFTGFTGTFNSAALFLYGDLTVVSGMTLGTISGTVTLSGTSGTKVIKTGTKSFDFSVTQNAPGATWQLFASNNFTLSATRVFTLTAGTIDLNSNTFSSPQFTSTGSTTRVLAFGTNGILSLSGTSPFTASGSGFTTTGTGTITLTSGSAKAFAGGGFNYVATLNQGGAGTLTISGSNTFYDITATTVPSTITFTAGTTQTVTQFTASGTAGNLLTLNSSSPGTAFYLSDSSGTNSVSYCSLTDSHATGGATWNAYLTNGNVNGGSNNNWNFAPPVTYSYSADIKLRSMAQRGRF